MIDWLEKHMIVTLILVLGIYGLVFFVTLIVFLDPPNIPGSTSAAYATLFGGLAVAIGLWQFRTRVIDRRKGIEHPESQEKQNTNWWRGRDHE